HTDFLEDRPMTVSTDNSDQETQLLITRVFNAPRERVWEAWTDPKHVAAWWGPRGFTTKVTELDLRPGGRSRYVMIGPDGKEYPAVGVIQEIVPYERIVTTDDFEEGHDYGMDDLPQGIILTCLFEELEGAPGKTRLTLRIQHPDAETRRKHEKMGVVGGWNSSLDCLEEHL